VGERQQIRIGMIGYKFMGKAHSNAYRQVPFFFDPGADLIMDTIVGRNEDEVREAGRKMGWRSYETDWRKVVERNDIDVIDIVTPNHMHHEIAVAALEAGKHVICEKPLAINLDQALEMKKAADKAKKINMIVHNYRFAPAVQFAKKMIAEGKIGRIHHIRATYLNDRLLDPKQPFRWRLSKAAAGSGALGDIGSHIIDLARFLVGEFQEVTGMMKTFVSERPMDTGNGAMGKVDVDDAVAFLAAFKNGAVGVFEATRYAGGNKNGNRFEINGEKGSIRWDLENMNNLQVYLVDDEVGFGGFRTIHCTEAIHPYAQAYWPPGHIIGYEHTFINLIHELVRGITEGAFPAPDFEDGLRNQAVLEAVELSVERGRWVQISELLDV